MAAIQRNFRGNAEHVCAAKRRQAMTRLGVSLAMAAIMGLSGCASFTGKAEAPGACLIPGTQPSMELQSARQICYDAAQQAWSDVASGKIAAPLAMGALMAGVGAGIGALAGDPAMGAIVGGSAGAFCGAIGCANGHPLGVQNPYANVDPRTVYLWTFAGCMQEKGYGWDGTVKEWQIQGNNNSVQRSDLSICGRKTGAALRF